MRNQPTRISMILALACAAAAAASCVRVEADIPEAEVTQKAVKFQGIPGGGQLGEVSTTQSFTLTADDLSWAKDLNSDVYAYEVEIKAVGAIQDLSFIHFAHVSISSGAEDSTAPAVEVVNYERPADAVASPTISAKTLVPINVTQVWAQKKVIITMNLIGVFPEEEWSADVTLHMSGKISYKF